MAVATYTKSGTKATTPAKLDKDIFAVDVSSHELIKQAYLAYLANGRSAAANVKTRGLVRGGGKKPWKQKGTGRARFGSTRNPIWRGGGIVFGPTGHENYTQKITTSSKRRATKQALSLATTENKVSVIEAFNVTSGKTADAVKLLDKLGANRSVLIVVDSKTPELLRATSNLDYVKVVQSRYLNVYDIVNAHSIIVTTAGLTAISEWLNEKPAAKPAAKKVEAK